MKYKGKYSLNENLLEGRGLGLLKEELLQEGGSTVWGSGWASEVTVTKAFGGTLKPNHLNGSHSPSGDAMDADINKGNNEVKERMAKLGEFTTGAGNTLIPLEIQAGRTGQLEAGSLSAQLRRYCKKNLGGIVDWKPGVYDAEAKASAVGEDTVTDAELAEIGSEMRQFLSSEFFCCVFSGENIDIYNPDMRQAKALGVAPYFGSNRRPIVVFEIPLGTAVKQETKTAVRDFLTQGGCDLSKADAGSPLA
jgi:hypothetical protein